MQTTHSLQQKTEDKPKSEGPAPHEDLTIAEHLETMRQCDEHRPGEKCFVTGNHETLWVDEDQLTRFIREFGAEHPSDYFSQHGTQWQDDLFHQD